MTKAQFVSAVKRRLGFRTDLDTEIIAESVIAQQRLGRVAPYPWFLLQPYDDLVDEQNDLTLHESYIAFAYEPYSIFFTDSPQYRLKLIPMSDMKNDLETVTTTVAARPQFVAVAGLNLSFNAVPDQPYSLRIYAYLDDLDLDSYADGASNLWLKYAGELLVLETTRRIAVDSRDAELAGFLAGEAAQARAELNTETFAKNESGVERIIREYAGETSGRPVVTPDTDTGA